MSKYQDLNTLEGLREKGAITEEEYQREKAKILNNNSSADNMFGMTKENYTALMHFSQFAGFLLPGLGFVAPIILWLINRDNETVDLHGKNITNFLISMIIYCGISVILCFIFIGIILLGILAVMYFIFIILAAVKASRGEYWKYPLSITFFS